MSEEELEFHNTLICVLECIGFKEKFCGLSYNNKPLYKYEYYRELSDTNKIWYSYYPDTIGQVYHITRQYSDRICSTNHIGMIKFIENDFGKEWSRQFKLDQLGI